MQFDPRNSQQGFALGSIGVYPISINTTSGLIKSLPSLAQLTPGVYLGTLSVSASGSSLVVVGQNGSVGVLSVTQNPVTVTLLREFANATFGTLVASLYVSETEFFVLGDTSLHLLAFDFRFLKFRYVQSQYLGPVTLRFGLIREPANQRIVIGVTANNTLYFYQHDPVSNLLFQKTSLLFPQLTGPRAVAIASDMSLLIISDISLTQTYYGSKTTYDPLK